MSLSREFIAALCCPSRRCRGDVSLSQKEGNTILRCADCHSTYPIVDGIPILYPNDTYAPSTHKRHWDQDKNATSYAKKYDSYLQKQGTPWGLYTHESELRAVKRLTKDIDLAGKTIIDGGCGNGRLLSSYPEAAVHIGVDTSLTLLQATKRREPGYWLVCAQLEDMPFKDAVADFSISIRVYQHLRAPEQAFAEMVRTTKPQGYVALEVYNKYNSKELYKRFRMMPAMEKRRSWGLAYDAYFSYRDIEKWCDQTFVTPIGYSGAGWGIHFWLFEELRFRYIAPKWLQVPVFNFFLGLENLVSTMPFFRVTLEKICFIGSIQSAPKKRVSFLRRIVVRVKRKKQKKQADVFGGALESRNYAFAGTDTTHLRHSVDWLVRAHDATPDGGVSRGVSIVSNGKENGSGWQPSYPETTGYIIPTMIHASTFFSDSDLMQRAKQMGNWELAIMHDDGAVHGGNMRVSPNKAVFDTGQVIRGLFALYKETGLEKYLDGAKKAANWIASREHNKEGRWIIDNASSVNTETTTYNIYAIAPLVALGLDQVDQTLVEAGRRAAEHTITLQNEYGWFADADFQKKEDALLHTIAYTVDGLWDIGEMLDDQQYMSAARKAIDGIVSQMDDIGMIPGRLGSDWRGTADWACLTGIAQTAVTCQKVYKKTGIETYTHAAETMKGYLKARQNMMEPRFGGLGAVWGSWPISGEYGRYEALNWAVKYMADVLLDSVQPKSI